MKMQYAVLAGFILVIGLAGLNGCETDEEESCTAGESETCECDSGTEGSRVCLDDATWGECACTRVRFCTDVDNESQPVTFTVRYGDPVNQNSVTFETGACDTLEGEPCVEWPAGEPVAVEVSTSVGDLPPMTLPALETGKEYLMWLALGEYGPVFAQPIPFPLLSEDGEITYAEECSDFSLNDLI